MNILIVGAGRGSWQMRGVQLGAALGARVTSTPTDADWEWAERVVLVKRAALQWAKRAHVRGVPIVWDALDFWRQPPDNGLSAGAARALLGQMQDRIAPTLTVGATQAMAAAAANGRRSAYLPHQGHRDLVPTDAREVCQVVGYDGNPVYLDHWAAPLRAACRAVGWTFVVNPPTLAAVDILVALRGGIWDGWMCREWKSGVKAVNAILAGRPLITQPSAAVRELQPLGSIIETVAQVRQALETWAPHARRQQVVDLARTRTTSFTVDTLAAQYAALLAEVKDCPS